MADGRLVIFALLILTSLMFMTIYFCVEKRELRFEYGNLRLIHLWAESAQPTTAKPFTPPPSYDDIMKSFLNITGPNITKDNWKGQCPYPWYIPPAMQNQSWFQPFLRHLQRVDLSKAGNRYIAMRDCSRWWSSTPQVVYDDPPPRDRTISWKPKPKPPPGYKRPKCKNFGRQLVNRTSCSSKHEILWRTLDELGILYFPRSGTDLGIARGSAYLTADGDLDIYVDMPQRQLMEKLKKVLKPEPYFSEYKQPYWFRTETHWKVKGCPTVHMVFNDWMEDEMSRGNYSQRSGHMDTCECLMNSVPLSCHKETIYRTWLKFGPSWRVPLHAKALDVPHRAREYNVVRVLRRLVSKDGVIHEDTIRNLDKSIKYSAPEMEMILAQVNELHALINCQAKARCVKG